MKVSPKGVVTIPASLRSMFDISPGDEVEFIEEGGKVFLAKATGSGAFLFAQLIVTNSEAEPKPRRRVRGDD